MPNFYYGDIKYYRKLHVKKMKAIGELPTSYSAFSRRLKKMTLADAIEKGRTEHQVRDRSSKTPIQDSIRRSETLRKANVKIVDLDDLIKLEKRDVKVYTYHMNPKKTLRQKFIGLFK